MPRVENRSRRRCITAVFCGRCGSTPDEIARVDRRFRLDRPTSWNLTTVGSSTVTVELAAGANHAVFDPGGRVDLATACGDGGTARVWDATTGQPLAPVMSHGRGVTHVAFRGDGRLIAATASFDSVTARGSRGHGDRGSARSRPRSCMRRQSPGWSSARTGRTAGECVSSATTACRPRHCENLGCRHRAARCSAGQA